MWKKMTAVALAVCMLCTLIVPAFGAKKLHYDSVVFLGDSISLGYTMRNGINNSYDYYDHLLSQESNYIKKAGKDGPEGNPYTYAYPYVFAKLAGTNLDYAYNYGIAGGMADDISALLSADINTIRGVYNAEKDEWVSPAFSDIGSMNLLRSGFSKAIGRDEALHNFVTDLRKNIKTSDLVAVSTGGNDIYQNFLYTFQYPDSMEKVEKMGIFGVFVNIVTMLMQFETSWEDIFDTLNNLEETLGLDSGSDDEEETASQQEESGGEEGGEEGGETGGHDMDLSSLISLESFTKLADYFSEENIKDFFFNTQEGYEKSIIQDWEDAYSEIVASINEMNPNADIALISQYNPFGVKNYMAFLKQQWEKGEILNDVKLDTYTAARVIRTLMTKLVAAEQYQDSDSNLMNELLMKALSAALNELLPMVGEEKEVYEYTYIEDGKLQTKSRTQTLDEFLKDHPELTAGSVVCTDTGKTKLTFTEEDNDALYELVQDLCYPVMTLMVGTGLQTVYDEMNAHLQKIAMKYSKATYVDITGAPASGRLDPHPGADQHEWIAKRIYEEMTDAVSSPMYNSTVSKIIEAASKTSNFIRTLLHIPGTSLVDQMIDSVQEITARVESIMAIPKMMRSILFPFLPR